MSRVANLEVPMHLQLLRYHLNGSPEGLVNTLKWLIDLKTGKTNFVLFDCSNESGANIVSMVGSVLDRTLSLKILGLFSS